MITGKIENIHYLIPGNKYKITHTCYDDYDEGLVPEIEVVEVIQKNRNSFLLRNVEHDYGFEISFTILMDCKIEEFIK